MFAMTGITGKVGGAVARLPRAAGQDVRAVVRGEAKGAAWAPHGCEVAMADAENAGALQRA